MLGELIKERMDALGLRQQDVASRAGLSRQYVSDLVTGKRGTRLSARTQQQLARALRVSPSRLLASVASPDSESASTDGGRQA